VLDAQLVPAAAELVRGRLQLVERLGPAVDEAYEALAEDGRRVGHSYEAEWAPEPLGIDGVDEIEDHLRAALVTRRFPAEVDLVELNRPPERAVIGIHQERAQLVQPGPGGFVRAEPQQPLQILEQDSSDVGLAGGWHVIRHLEDLLQIATPSTGDSFV